MSSKAWAVVALFLAAWGSAPPSAGAQVAAPAEVRGAISGRGPDGQPFRIPGVSVTLRPTTGDARGEVSNERGEFEFLDIPPGPYTLEAQLDGFGEFSDSIVLSPGGSATRDVELALAGVHEDVLVVAGANGGSVTAVAPPAEIAQSTMQQVPIASETFQSALPLVPGVVRGQDGLLNVKGAREDQSSLRVDNANVADPVTGEFAFRMPIEAMRSVQVVTSPYLAEFGQINGGVTKIETTSGTDSWKVQIQNFQPRLKRRAGEIRGIESWTPRAAVGGPIVRGRLRSFAAVEYQFVQTLVEGLPPLEADTKTESLSTFGRLDWTASGADRLSTAVAVFPQKREFLGLNTFNPQSVTPNLRQRAFLWTVTERRVLRANALLEVNGSIRQLDTEVFPGTALPNMILAPGRNGGGYFNTQSRRSHRYEGLAEYSLTPKAFGASHLLKVGLGAGREAYDGTTESRPVIIVRADGTRAEEIVHEGRAALVSSKTDVLAFVQDSWSVASHVTVDLGVRFDRDTVAAESHVAPRGGVSWNVGRTTVRGGVGLFFDKVTLNAVAFDQLPARRTTRFDQQGEVTPGGAQVLVPAFGRSALRNPRSVAWNAQVERELSDRAVVRLGYQQRVNTRQLIVEPRPGAAGIGSLVLENNGSSRYREFEFTGRYHLRGQQVVASYVRSVATGDLNNLNAYFANLQDPVIRANERSVLPFNAPHRVVSWGEFGLPWGTGIAPLVEVRSGFPYSVFDANRDFVGRRNEGGRFPRFFALDMQVWKDVKLPRGLRARVGIKVFNITNHFNPRDVDGNLSSPGFGDFSSGVSRAYRGKFVIDF